MIIKIILLILNIYAVLADISIRNHNGDEIQNLDDVETYIGPNAPYNGISGHHIIIDIKDPCHDIWPHPPTTKQKWFAVINYTYTRECFIDMLHKAQSNHYQALFIHPLSNLTNREINANETIKIYSCYISNYTLEYLKIYSDPKNYTTFYYRSLDEPAYLILILFIIFFLTGIAGILLGFLVYLCFQSIKKRKDLLARWKLNRIPCHYFQKGDVHELCVICLDEYVEKDKLRILPCNHVFHSKCVDTWLTKNKKTCPLCKVDLCIRAKKYPWLCCFAPGDLDIVPSDETTPLLAAMEDSDTDDVSIDAPLIQSSSNQTSVTVEIHHSRPLFQTGYGSTGITEIGYDNVTPDPMPRFVVGSIMSEEEGYRNGEEIV